MQASSDCTLGVYTFCGTHFLLQSINLKNKTTTYLAGRMGLSGDSRELPSHTSKLRPNHRQTRRIKDRRLVSEEREDWGWLLETESPLESTGVPSLMASHRLSCDCPSLTGLQSVPHCLSCDYPSLAGVFLGDEETLLPLAGIVKFSPLEGTCVPLVSAVGLECWA